MGSLSIGDVLATATRTGARVALALAPALAAVWAPVIAAVASGGARWAPLALALDVPVAAIVGHAVVAALRGRSRGAWPSAAAGLRRLLACAAAMLLVYLVAAALAAAMLLPVWDARGRGPAAIAMLLGWGAIELVLYARWFVVVPVALFERGGARHALARAAALTAPHRRALGAVVAVVAAVLVAAALIAELAVGVRGDRWFFDDAASPALAALGVAAWAVASVWRAALSAVAYQRLRHDADVASPAALEGVFE